LKISKSRLPILIALIVGFIAMPVIPDDAAVSFLLQFIGYVLLMLCAFGRLYATLYIGGVKNGVLVTSGPYSVSRNPLAFFTLLGAVGVGLAAVQLMTALLLGFYFWKIYNDQIVKEERFLADKFGADYTSYAARVPRLLPNLRLFTQPEEVLSCSVPALMSTLRDTVWWVAPMPVFMLAKHLQIAGTFKPWLSVL